MKPFLNYCLPAALLGACLALAPAYASDSARQLPMAEVLQAALARQPVEPEPAPFTASAWLAALPSLDVSYLQSDERLGTDETDLGLNLPLKSPYLREQDRRLRELSGQLAEAESARRGLYYSGLIREAAWTARIAQARVELTGQKLDLLREMLQREEAMLEARGTSRYNLLLVRQEIADARLALEDQQAEHRLWLERFRQLTGLGTLPERLEEDPAPAQQSWTQHPALLQMDLAWEQQRALIAAGSERSAPWTVRLGAKQLDSPDLKENQYGLSVEVPLGFLGTADQASSSDWQEAARTHWRQRDELQLALEQGWQQLTLEAGHLQRRQALLDEAVTISAELGEQAVVLRDLNELGRERWLQRQMQDLERRAAATLNTLEIGQNRAMQRQAAGMPL